MEELSGPSETVYSNYACLGKVTEEQMRMRKSSNKQ